MPSTSVINTTMKWTLTTEAYNPVLPYTCLCKPTRLIMYDPLHNPQNLQAVRSSFSNSDYRVLTWGAPLTMVSHSFNARAFVLFKSVSSSLRESVFIDDMILEAEQEQSRSRSDADTRGLG